jgi:Outer membrane protein beta-barrel domain
MKKTLLIFILSVTGYTANSQVLISILLGDKLNTGKIEFGLDGGLNLTTIQGLDNADYFSGFNIGFYFDIKVFKNPQWMLNTGVIVKSTHGADGLPVYSLNDAALDSTFAGGSVSKRNQYFNVPIEIKYQFKNRIYAKAGVMAGLRYKASDKFKNSINDDDDLNFSVDTKDDYHPIDFGLVAGLGYRLIGGNGMNLGVQYYQGLVDITIDDSNTNEYNSGFYFTVGIPIGKAKAEKAKAE